VQAGIVLRERHLGGIDVAGKTAKLLDKGIRDVVNTTNLIDFIRIASDEDFD
jgi:hypothetical protein